MTGRSTVQQIRRHIFPGRCTDERTMDNTDRMTDKWKTSTRQTITDRRTYRKREGQWMDYERFLFFSEKWRLWDYNKSKTQRKRKYRRERWRYDKYSIGSRAPLFPCAKYSSAMYSRVLWQQVFTPPAYTEQNIENTNYTLKLFLSARNYSLPRWLFTTRVNSSAIQTF